VETLEGSQISVKGGAATIAATAPDRLHDGELTALNMPFYITNLSHRYLA
jgi:hypothetical protein